MLVRELVDELRTAGFTLVRSKGSHGQWLSPDGKTRITVTMNHRSRTVAPIILDAWKKYQRGKTA